MKEKKKKNKVVAFSIADEKNMPYFKKLEKSFHHFHPDIELKVVDGKELERILKADPMFFYRATPVIAWNLMREGYETVVKIDADSIILGNLEHTWNGDFDVGVVNNSNPKEMSKYPVSVWNIHPISYLNCGYVVMKSPQFISHWLGLCASAHFDHYQFREQDLLNIMCFYMNNQVGGPYKIGLLDSADKAHGLITRGYEPQMILKKGKVILPANKEWNDKDKEVVIFHEAGGDKPNKFNFDTIFSEEVVEWVKKLTED